MTFLSELIKFDFILLPGFGFPDSNNVHFSIRIDPKFSVGLRQDVGATVMGRDPCFAFKLSSANDGHDTKY